MEKFLIEHEGLSLFLKRVQMIENCYGKWFKVNHESLINYFERTVFDIDSVFIYIEYKFKKDKKPALPVKIKREAIRLIREGTRFKIIQKTDNNKDEKIF